MWFKFIFALFFHFVVANSLLAINCPPKADFPPECTCYSFPYNMGIGVDCIENPVETWDIKASFDAVAEALGNPSAYIQSININAELVSQQLQVPAHAIGTLRTPSLEINAGGKLTFIHPQAFSGSNDTLTDLQIRNKTFADPKEAFDLINNFVELFSFSCSSCIFPTIPANAFDSKLQKLAYVGFYSSKVESIGDFAFAGLPNLAEIRLYGNDLTVDGISNLAFVFAKQDVLIQLDGNTMLTHLPEEKFAYVLDNGNSISLGDCEQRRHLYCDERMDWICSTNYTRVSGYYCREPEFLDIFDYCAQKFGEIPLDRIQNLEEFGRIELQDRLKIETVRHQQRLLTLKQKPPQRHNAN